MKIAVYLVWSFAALLPFCMVREFDRLNEGVSGIFVGNMVWFTVPFSMLIEWARCGMVVRPRITFAA